MEEPQHQQEHKARVIDLSGKEVGLPHIYELSKLSYLLKLDLSNNKLTTFPIGFTFKVFTSLKILFLHENKFNSIKTLQSIGECFEIEYLTLFGNPLPEAKTRHYFINHNISLKLMDNRIVTLEERNPEIMTLYMNNCQLSFPLLPEFSSNLLSSSPIAILIAELFYIRQKYRKANPLILIQRWLRKIKNKNSKKEEEEKQNKINFFKELSYKSNEKKNDGEKILSLFKMNACQMQILKEFSCDKIYVHRLFAIKNKLDFKEIGEKYLFLKYFNREKEGLRIKGLNIIISESLKLIIRTKGSHDSSICKKKNILSQIYFKHKNKSQSESLITLKSKEIDSNLSILFDKYSQHLVEINGQTQNVYTILKEHFKICLHTNVNFPFYPETFVQRISASVSIQRTWRGYLCRKKINLQQIICEKYAAIIIQRFIRNLKFIKRQRALMEIESYLTNEKNSNQIIIEFGKLSALESKWKKLETSINFSLIDQKLKLYIHPLQKQILISPNLKSAPFPKYLHSFLPDIQNTNFSPLINPLDLLFQGSVLVNYLHITNPSEPQLNKKNEENKKEMKKYVAIKYLTSEEAIKRKFVLALISFCFHGNNFIRSTKLDPIIKNEKLICNINQEINNNFFIAKTNEAKEFRNEEMREKSSGIKVKVFVKDTDFSTQMFVYYPTYISISQNQEDKNAILLKSERSKQSLPKINQISRKVINLFPPAERKYFKETKNEVDLKNMESPCLSKSSTFQPLNKLNKMHYDNIKAEKQDDPLISNRSVAEFGKSNKEESLYYSSLINKTAEIKELHRSKIEFNQIEKELFLSKVRDFSRMESETNEKRIEQSKLENMIENERIRNKVRLALSKKLDETKKFEIEFVKRGNSNPQKEKFHGPLISERKRYRSPENVSINQPSRNSQNENSEEKRKNIPTEIKEFSFIDSEIMGDLCDEENQINRNRINSKKYEKQNERYKSGKSLKKYYKNHAIQINPLLTEETSVLPNKRMFFELPKIKDKK